MQGSLINKILNFCLYCVVSFIIIFAIIATLARMANPLAQSLKEELTETLQSRLSIPVEIHDFQITWQEMNPVIWFNQVKLGEKTTRLKVARIVSTVDLWSSLLQQNLILKKIIFKGALLRFKINEDVPPEPSGSNPISLPKVELATSPSNKENRKMEQWLASIPGLYLRDSLIELEHKGKTSIFSKIHIDIINKGKQHQFRVNAELPHGVGKRVEMVINAYGSRQSMHDWKGTLYFNVERLFLPWLSQEFAEIPGKFQNGISSLKLWSHWEKGQLVRVHAFSKNQLLQYVDDAGAHYWADQLAGEFMLKKNKDNLVFSSNNLHYALDRQDWNTGKVKLLYKLNDKNLSGFLQNIQLDTIPPLLKAQPWFKKVNFIQGISGSLSQTWFNLKLDKQQLSGVGLSSQLHSVSLQKNAGIPGIKNFSGQLTATKKQILLQSKSQNMVFDSNGVFRNKIFIDQLKGILAIDWHKNVQIQTASLYLKNAHVKAHTRFTVKVEAEKPLYMDMVAKLINVDAETVPLYLPVNVMSRELIGWLDNSINRGKVDHCYLLLKGNMNQFPFDDFQGTFDIGFNTRGLLLDYQQGWPKLRRLDADVRFIRSKMLIRAKKAMIKKVRFKQLEAEIRDLNKPFLVVKGKGQGDFSYYKHFVNQSPLKSLLGVFMDQFDFAGPAAIQLKTRFDLDGDTQPKIKGTISLKKAEMFSKALSLKMKKIRGDIHFTEKDILAKNIHFDLLGESWKLKAYTRKDVFAKPLSTRIYLTGKMPPGKMVSHYSDAFPILASGSAKWKVSIDLPIADKGGFSGFFADIESDLKGVRLKYPKPLAKFANQKRALKIHLELPANQDIALINGSLKSVFSLLQKWQTDGQWQLTSSQLNIGNLARAEISKNSKAIDIKLDYLDIDAWRKLLQQQDKQTGKSGNLLSALDRIKVDLNKLKFNQKISSNFHLSLNRKNKGHDFAVNSVFLQGQGFIPQQPGDKLKLNLNLVKMDYLLGNESSDWKIADVPSANISIKKLVIKKDIPFHKIEIKMENRQNKVLFRQLDFHNPHFVFKAKGLWKQEQNNKQDKTSIVFNIETDNLGQALTNFGYNDAFKDGKGSFSGDLNWPGSPLEASLSGLNGHFNLDIKKGNLKNVEVGAGRYFGLFSLQALPRRLLLDFRDIFETGFSFDQIKGDFKIVQGDAYTHNLTMDASIGKVAVAGRTGLDKKDYDQIMTFTPAIFSNLPVVGAMAAGPQTGLTLLLLDALLKSLGADISKTGEVNYQLTGTWDNPKMELLSIGEVDDEDEDF